jgi:NADP-dependent 3-hydroxy acid dehydrogenase YdfG
LPVDGAMSVACDVRKKVDVVKVAEGAKERFGQIDILINNTGLGIGSKIVECSEEDWHLVLDTNLTGTFLMTQAVLPDMIARRSGYIINIASQAAKHGYANAGPYCASKFGIIGLSEALQHEVREYGIHVHCLCPGLVQVPPPQNESEVRPGVLQVEDLASVALFLLKQPSRVQIENIGLYHF